MNAVETVTIEFSGKFKSDNTRVWKKSGIAYVNIGFGVESDTIHFSHGEVVATNLPAPMNGIIVYANKFNNGDADIQPIRFRITAEGTLEVYYPSDIDSINPGSPVYLNVSYPISANNSPQTIND